MKKIILLLLVLISVSLDTNAQLFKSLMDGIKDKVKERAEKTYNDVKEVANNQVKGVANDLTEEGINQLNNFVIVSQVKQLEENKSNPIIKTKKQNPSKDNSNLIEPSVIDNAFKNEYPEFYMSYNELKQNDKQVKEIIFGYPKEHLWTCKSISKSGIIYFDLYFFENKKISEKRSIFDLYQMSGYIHCFNENPTKFKNQIERQVFVYEFALKELKKYAIVNKNIDPLKYAVRTIEKRANNQDEINNSDDNKEQRSQLKNKACKLVILEKEFKEAEEYIKSQNSK